MDVKTIKRLLGEARPKKGLGQHFLLDETVLDKIVAAAELTGNDTVLEVGPGLGILTRALAEHAGRVVAVELDENILPVLKNQLRDYPNVEIVPDDILELAPGTLVDAPYKVAANLPYYITSAVIRHLLEAEHPPSRLLLMMQLEVAQRILAEPGDMGTLSVAVQFYGKPTMVARVPPGAFWPPPNVDSAVLRIDVYPEPPVDVEDVEWFFKVVRAGFQQRRKQLRNSLSGGLHHSKGEVDSALDAAGVDRRRRAQTLTLEEWAVVAAALKASG